MGPDGQAAVVLLLALVFTAGVVQSLRTYCFARRTLREQITRRRPTREEVEALARRLDCRLPFILILVPARDESAVIYNTLCHLAQLDYPAEQYAIVVIADGRERQGAGGRTTFDVAADVARRWRDERGKTSVHVIEVPDGYSGRFGDPALTHARSTKSRALNYALEYICRHSQLSRSDMLGVLDADGRLHPEVLREVAYLLLARGERLLQGPVFQISNLSRVGLAGKAAGIELSLYHLSSLARQLLSERDTARFLAGTNYFIDPQLLIEVGAWKDDALVEDAELGLRLYLRKRVKAAWLSCPEVEQTPPDVRSYLRQRRRWALGHFQLLPMIRGCELPWYRKMELYGRLLHSVVMCPLDVGLPVAAWTVLALRWGAGLPEAVHWAMLALLAASLFVWDYFGRGLRMIDGYAPVPTPRSAQWLISLQLFVAMPWLMILQAAPRLIALIQYSTGQYSRDWEKTPRTVEIPGV
jgi:hypothetical protein